MHLAAVRRGSQYHFHRAIRKYGADAFRLEVIYTAKTTAELTAMETFFIVLYQSHKPENGYNMTLGGDTPRMTPEIRAKLSLIGKQKYAAGLGLKKYQHLCYTPEALKKNADARRGIHFTQKGSSPLLGKSKSFEHCKNISLARRGVRFSQEHKDSLREAARTKTWTPERRARQAVILQEMKERKAKAIHA